MQFKLNFETQIDSLTPDTPPTRVLEASLDINSLCNAVFHVTSRVYQRVVKSAVLENGFFVSWALCAEQIHK